MPAPRPHMLQALLEGMFLLLRRMMFSSSLPRRVHAALVLREEVFAIEVVGDARGRALEPLSAGFAFNGKVHVAAADVAAVEAELEVLRRDVSLPFVLGDERAGTAVVREAADEGPSGRVFVRECARGIGARCRLPLADAACGAAGFPSTRGGGFRESLGLGRERDIAVGCDF